MSDREAQAMAIATGMKQERIDRENEAALPTPEPPTPSVEKRDALGNAWTDPIGVASRCPTCGSANPNVGWEWDNCSDPWHDGSLSEGTETDHTLCPECEGRRGFYDGESGTEWDCETCWGRGHIWADRLLGALDDLAHERASLAVIIKERDRLRGALGEAQAVLASIEGRHLPGDTEYAAWDHTLGILRRALTSTPSSSEEDNP